MRRVERPSFLHYPKDTIFVSNLASLDGKWALVTGGGKRLGRAIALSLAEGGANVLVHVHSTSGDDVARSIEALGRRAVVVRADLSTSRGAVELAHAALSTAGHLDVLVNNAAVFLPTPFLALTTASWRQTLQTNLTAPLILALTVGRAMRARGAGKIVQLGDWAGIRPVSSYLPYCVSKGGVLALTLALAKAFAPRVQVNAVAPGPVLPPASYNAAQLHAIAAQTPLRRVGREDDVARAVRFLAEATDFITGTVYSVDGGWLAKVGDGSDTFL
jgi:pteridine reductase